MLLAALTIVFVVYQTDTHHRLFQGEVANWQDCEVEAANWTQDHRGVSYAVCEER